jgi:hypothetical protein
LEVAEASLNRTLPKSPRGSGWQSPVWSQLDGASAIHSALETSGLFIVSDFVADWPVVVSVKDTVTLVPSTDTLPVTWSPGEIASPSRTGAAGTSSYQA